MAACPDCMNPHCVGVAETGLPAALPISHALLQCVASAATGTVPRPPVATMLEPASSLPAAQQQPEPQQVTTCNGSNSEQQCGDQGCGVGSDPLPAAAAVPAPGTVCIKCRKAEAEVSAGCCCSA